MHSTITKLSKGWRTPELHAIRRIITNGIKRRALLLISVILLPGQLLAQSPQGSASWGQIMGIEIIETIVYSTIGIVMAVIGFKVVDWLTPGDLADEVTHKENRALAILAGAMMLGVCVIIASVLID